MIIKQIFTNIIKKENVKLLQLVLHYFPKYEKQYEWVNKENTTQDNLKEFVLYLKEKYKDIAIVTVIKKNKQK